MRRPTIDRPTVDRPAIDQPTMEETGMALVGAVTEMVSPHLEKVTVP